MSQSTSRRPSAFATVIVDDEKVCVTRFDFEPGAETGWHTHGHDYVVTPISQCNFLLEEPDGSTRSASMAPGEAYRRPAGVEHNVINGGDKPMSFVEVELK